MHGLEAPQPPADVATDPLATRPIVLGPNQPPRPYQGGPGIDRLRGNPVGSDDRPEDFVASTTPVFGSDSIGLTLLEDGRTLRDHVAADPIGFLGAAHVRRYHDNVALLVKLLNPQQRLFVHFHPDASFAARHLDCDHGKSEGWIITDVAGPDDAYVYLGFRKGVEVGTVASWVSSQRIPAMLDGLNRIAVRPGDTFFVPAGIPHAIGAGITAVELQEPTDFSILLEWAGFDLPEAARDLGLGFETAVQALDRTAWNRDRLGALREVRPSPDPGVEHVFPAIADEFFRAERVRSAGEITFSAGFSVIIVLRGDGVLATGTTKLDLRTGMCLLVPYGAGSYRISGDLDAIRCLPPHRSVPQPDVS